MHVFAHDVYEKWPMVLMLCNNHYSYFHSVTSSSLKKESLDVIVGFLNSRDVFAGKTLCYAYACIPLVFDGMDHSVINLDFYCTGHYSNSYHER